MVLGKGGKGGRKTLYHNTGLAKGGPLSRRLLREGGKEAPGLVNKSMEERERGKVERTQLGRKKKKRNGVTLTSIIPSEEFKRERE